MITLTGKDPKLAMMMEAALGVDAAPLLAMQNEYDMLMAVIGTGTWV